MKNKKVLFIDDDTDILDLVRIILEGENIKVIASTNLDALENIVDLKPDLILLDERLGQKSGSDLCEEIRQVEELSDVPIVLISAVINLNKIAEKCGADAFIEKPFDVDQLITVINSLLDSGESV